MFGWLTTRTTPLCRHVAASPVSRRWLALTPHDLAQRLPSLGNLLYVYSDDTAHAEDVFASGVIAAQRTLTPLLRTHHVAVACVITDDGPREWCECLDADGRILARLHLLPDTDYLAWDALFGDGYATRAPMRWGDVAPFKAGGACLTCFVARSLAGITLLQHVDATGLSPLGADMAARIARAEAMRLTTRVSAA